MLSDMAGRPSNRICSENQNRTVLLDYSRVPTDSGTNKNSLVSFSYSRVDGAQQSFRWNFSRCKSGLPSRCHYPDSSCRRFLDRRTQGLAKSLGPTGDHQDQKTLCHPVSHPVLGMSVVLNLSRG